MFGFKSPYGMQPTPIFEQSQGLATLDPTQVNNTAPMRRGLGGLLGSTPGGLAGNEKLMILGSMLSDLARGQGPQNIMATQGMISERQKEAQKLQATERMKAKFAELRSNPNATRDDWLAAFGEDLLDQNNIGAALSLAPPAPKDPAYVQGPGGWWETGAGIPRLAVPVEKERQAPTGMVEDETGNLIPDENYLKFLEARAAATARGSRGVQLAMPLPSRARGRSGGGKGGAAPKSKLPAGFILD